MGRHDLLLAQVSDELVDQARAVVEWLVGDVREFTEIGRADVQRLLWIDLPTRWTTPSREWPLVAEACARVLALAGRPGLAAVATGEDTREVLDAYARSAEDGTLAATAAFTRTGMTPPDTDLLTWGRTLVGGEADAYHELQRVLEAAVVVGGYTPGMPGWRHGQQALTESWLTSPSPSFEGRRPIDIIHSVRRAGWADSGTPARRAVVRPIVRSLVEAPPVPDGEPAPLVWLLGSIGDGVRLTRRGYLPTDLVREGDRRFGWSPPTLSATREIDAPPLLDLRDVARRHRLVTRRRYDLRLSARGRSVLLDPPRLWETAALAWLGDHRYDARVAEVATAYLLGESAESTTLASVAHEAVSREFREREGGGVRFAATEEAVWVWLRRGRTLGFLDNRPGQPRYALTDVGRSAALTALRARAHGPQN